MKRILLCLLLFSVGACDSTFVSSIPDYPVYLELDLTYEDKDLVPGMAYKIFTTPRKQVERIGFGGVLVYHGIDDYYAVDLSCPVEANRSIKVEVDGESIKAICPKCHSEYELLDGMGIKISGPGKESLKRYSLYRNGNKIFVQN